MFTVNMVIHLIPVLTSNTFFSGVIQLLKPFSLLLAGNYMLFITEPSQRKTTFILQCFKGQ